jgi:hypothetical protein
MPRAVNNPEDIAIVREFFDALSRSERLRMYDFFKSRIGSTRPPGGDSTLKPAVCEDTQRWISKQ